MKKPTIGITLDLAKNSEKYSYADFPWYAMRKNYADCVIRAGGVPIFLPYIEDSDSILNIIDGLIIPGCDEDIHPRFYGQEIRSDKVKTNDERAEFELALTRKAIEQNISIFGICNGMQVINVIQGGTLIQHLPDSHTSNINHEQLPPKNLPTHEIYIEADTIFEELMLNNKQQLIVNSTHHQSIDELGKGLIISARAGDGIIEAIESPEHKFLIGVQWHAEYLNTKLDETLFKKLIDSCKHK